MTTAVHDDMARLRAMSTSPHPPEPPRRSVVVDAVMGLTARRRQSHVVTPHLHGGSMTDKVEWEYQRADSFWDALDGYCGPEVLVGKDVLDAGCGWGGKDVRYAKSAGLKTIVGFDLPGIFDPEAPASYARDRGVENCTFTTGYAEE